MRSAAGRPARSTTLMTATTNEAIIAAHATAPDKPFESRRPRLALIRNPISGKRGISASTGSSPFEQRKCVGVQRLAVAVERDDDRQADRRFRGRDRHDEKHD